MVLLVTSDNEQFNTEKEIVERSVLIKNMLEDLGDAHLNQPIPIPNVSLPQAIQPKRYRALSSSTLHPSLSRDDSE